MGNIGTTVVLETQDHTIRSDGIGQDKNTEEINKAGEVQLATHIKRNRRPQRRNLWTMQH